MFDQITLRHAELQDFMQIHAEGLQNAALLLGGRPALKATRALVDDVCSTSVLTHRLRDGLRRLHDLLALV